MKRQFFSIESKAKYIFHWTLIYIMVVILAFVLSFATTYFSNKLSYDIANYDLQYYLDTGTFNPNVVINGANNLVYDKHGNLIDSCATHEFPKQWPRTVEKVLSKTKECDVYYTAILTNHIPKAVMVITAYPLDDDGAFIFYRHVSSFEKTFFVVFLISTILILMMAIYLYRLISIEQNAKQVQRNYIDNITHELKSPIASIKALTTGIYDGLVTDDNKRKDHCSIMLNELNRLERTVSDMLELSRIQNNQINCDKEVYTITDLFGEIIDKRRTLCEDLNIEIILEPAAEAFPLLHTNKVLAGRMMDILLDNAIKFSPVDGRILLNMTESSKHITIAIKDSGPGISPEERDLIFRRFYKSDKAHNEKGSGLGLAIAKEIADVLGEKLWLKSSSDEGAEFAFTIQKH